MLKLIKFLTPNFLILFAKKKLQTNRYKKKSLIVREGCDITNVNFGFNVYLGQNVNIRNSSIGDFSYINSGSNVQNTIIGKFSSIGPNVKIVLGNHPVNFISTHPIFYANNKPFKTFTDKMHFKEYGNVEIGNDVWIGQDVIIPGNVKIGDGAIITSKAVVTKDVEPYSIVGGVPAKHIKFRFNKEEIKKLLESKWWNKDPKWIKENYTLFLEKELFLRHIEKIEK